MSQPEVTVKNESSHNIWVIIAENQKHVIETKVRRVGETDFETYYKIMVEGKAALPIEGVPIEVGGSESQEFKARLKRYWEENKEAKYEWSQFIEPGELEIPPNRQNRWARKADEPIYYISIRTIQGRILADSVARQDETITIDSSGHLADEVPDKEKIENNSPVFFQNSSALDMFAGDPQTSNSNWDAGTVVKTGGSHFLVSDSGKLEAGLHVRIISNSKTLVDKKYKHMYSSDIGNVYYDKLRASNKRAGKKQLWKVSKTSDSLNSSGKKLCYGDRVKISNGNWPKANLGVNGKWLQCVNDEPTIWILRKEAKK